MTESEISWLIYSKSDNEITVRTVVLNTAFIPSMLGIVRILDDRKFAKHRHKKGCMTDAYTMIKDVRQAEVVT